MRLLELPGEAQETAPVLASRVPSQIDGREEKVPPSQFSPAQKEVSQVQPSPSAQAVEPERERVAVLEVLLALESEVESLVRVLAA